MSEQENQEPIPNGESDTNEQPHASVSDLVAKLVNSPLDEVIPIKTANDSEPSFMQEMLDENGTDYAPEFAQDEEDRNKALDELRNDDGVLLPHVDVNIMGDDTSDHPMPDRDTILLRMFSLNSIALHYYYASGGNWLDAYVTALDELSAVCLATPGSPVEYNDAASADAAALMLGYLDYETLVEDVSAKKELSELLRRFAESTIKFAQDYWFYDTDFSLVSPSAFARAVTSELRANWPNVKSEAAVVAANIGESEDDPFVVTVNDVPSRIIGINQVDETWYPLNMIVEPDELWQIAEEVDDSTDAIDDETTVEDDILSLMFLQSYQWENRSWNRAYENARSFCDSLCTFCWAGIANEYVSPDATAYEQRDARLQELAAELADENGNIQLKQHQGPFGPPTFDEQSQEFVDLLEAQQKVGRFVDIRNIVDNLLGTLSKIEGTPGQLILDDILASVYERAGGRDEKAQIKALDEIHADIIERLEKNQKAYKSHWKKYLSKNADANNAIKWSVPIIDMDDDGSPIFDARVMERTAKIKAQEEADAQAAAAEKAKNKKKRRH